MAKTRWLASQRVRLTAPASTVSARWPDSSWCNRSVSEIANAAATMPSMLNATAMKACSIALGAAEARDDVSRRSALPPISSPMPLTTLPMSRP